MSSEKKCPETPPKPKDGESQKLVEHLRSAHKSKEAMIENHFENKILQAYFNDELLGMDMDLVILTYMDPSMLILGPMIDFGTPHPEDTRTEKTRKMERQNHKIKALERYLMLASGIEIDSSMILTHPDLFVKWTLYNIESGKNIPSTKPSMKFRQKAGELAKMMIEKEAWKRQLVILENLSCETGSESFTMCVVCRTNAPCHAIKKNVSGFIKWFNFKKNYGFVTTKNDNRTIYLHYSGISPLIPESYWPTLLVPNQECLFDIGNCKSGLIAYNLTAILHENGSAYYNFAANMHEDRKIQAEEVPYVEPNVHVHER